MQTKTCKNCQALFEINPTDHQFYDKMQVPAPTFCPTCRQQRRTAFRNESSLYHRKCDFTGEKIISIYSEDKPYKVYKTDIWWGDKWDASVYGQDFDFNRSFFEQFKELQLKVPRPALTVAQLENSPFVNQAWFDKNCHLCFDMGFVEDGLYCYTTYHSKNLINNDSARDSELCYGLLDCQKCYNCVVMKDCSNCHDAYFSFDCKSCENIAFCSNLRNKKYHLFNKPVPKEEFEKFITEFKKGSYANFQKYIKDFKEKVIAKAIHKLDHNLNTENCTGDYILNSKNCHDSYLCDSSQDLKYCTRMDERIVDSMDLDNCSICELGYECMCMNGVNVKYCSYTYMDSHDCTYCDLVMSSGNCFGCVGLQHKNYCILNKQYTKEAYEELVPKIIEHMKNTGEWGEFFPAKISPVGYNDSISQYYLPLDKKEALEQDFFWNDYRQPKLDLENIEGKDMPNSIDDLGDDILNKSIKCENDGKYFRIIAPELKFYRKHKLAPPHLCPDCRHFERKAQMNPRILHNRKCDKCDISLKTTYAEGRPEIIYCDKCYLETMV